MAQEIILRLKPDGTREIETAGFKGKACIKAIEAMSKRLGKQGNLRKKAEFNHTEGNKEKETTW